MKGWGFDWCLDGVDVSVMAWCQTLCHCQWSPISAHPSMVSHSPMCFKAIVLLPLQSVCLCCCVVPLFFHNLSNPFSLTIVISLLFAPWAVFVFGFVGVCCVMSRDGVWGVDDAVCVSLSTPKKRQHSTRPCLHVMVCTNASCYGV